MNRTLHYHTPITAKVTDRVEIEPPTSRLLYWPNVISLVHNRRGELRKLNWTWGPWNAIEWCTGGALSPTKKLQL